MGQKVNPIGLRLALNKNWSSHWFARKDNKNNFGDWLHEDLKIRSYIKKNFNNAAISKILVERYGTRVRVTIYAARPGILIGRKGAELDTLKASVAKLLAHNEELILEVVEIKQPETNAQLVAESVAQQLERRVAFRRAMKRTVSMARKFGGEGIKVTCSGRLAGAEIARTEWYRDGRVPLQTLRADIDYGFAEAHTTYGIIGVKVWIYKGEILDKEVDQ